MQILTDQTGISDLVFIKIAIILGMLIYSAFAFILLKQVNLMTETLEVGFEKPIKLVAYLHLAASVLILIFSIVI